MPVVPYLAVAATLIGAEQSFMGGAAASKAAQQEAGLQRQQADLSLKNAQDNASVEAYNATQLVQRQKVAFLANGVTLEGSPADVLKNTTDQSQKNVQAILDRGIASYNLGTAQATQTENKGRSALLSGFVGGGVDLAKGTSDAYEAGLFDSTPKKKTVVEGVMG